MPYRRLHSCKEWNFRETTGNGGITRKVEYWEGGKPAGSKPTWRAAQIPKAPRGISSNIGEDLAGRWALRGVVALFLALFAALLLAAVRLRILGKGNGHGGREKCEAEHQSHQFLHCGYFS